MKSILKTLFCAVLLSFVWVGTTVAKQKQLQLPEGDMVTTSLSVGHTLACLPTNEPFEAISFDVGKGSFDAVILDAKEATNAKASVLSFMPIANEVCSLPKQAAVTPQDRCKQYKAYFVKLR